MGAQGADTPDSKLQKLNQRFARHTEDSAVVNNEQHELRPNPNMKFRICPPKK